MIPQLVAESISKFKPAKSMHVRSVGHKLRHDVAKPGNGGFILGAGVGLQPFAEFDVQRALRGHRFFTGTADQLFVGGECDVAQHEIGM